MGYMPQNIDATSKTIGLWCLAHKDQKFITVMEAREEFPNVAANRVAAIMARYEREGYLTRISRGFYRVIEDNVMDFERRLKPSAGEIEVVPAIDPSNVEINIVLRGYTLNVNTLLAFGVTELDPPDFVTVLDTLDSYSKTLVGIVKYARSNLDSFTVDPEQVTNETKATVSAYLKELFNADND